MSLYCVREERGVATQMSHVWILGRWLGLTASLKILTDLLIKMDAIFFLSLGR